MNKTPPSQASQSLPTLSSDGHLDKAKALRRLRRKLRQIERLSDCERGGYKLSPEQVFKVNTEANIHEKIDNLLS